MFYLRSFYPIKGDSGQVRYTPKTEEIGDWYMIIDRHENPDHFKEVYEREMGCHLTPETECEATVPPRQIVLSATRPLFLNYAGQTSYIMTDKGNTFDTVCGGSISPPTEETPLEAPVEECVQDM